MKTFILIACLLTYTAAQLSITPLSSGEITAGALANTTDSDSALKNVAHYSFEIPPNVESITISLNPDPNGNTACSYIYIFWSISTIPCGNEWSPGSNVIVPCQTTQREYTSTAYEHEVTIFAGEDDIAFYNTFGAGATLYLAVGKEGFDYIRTCPYTVKVESTNCTSSEVAVFNYGEPRCVNVMDRALPATFEADVEDTEIVYRFDLPQQVGSIQFEANSTGSLYAFGGYNFPANYASDLVPFCSDESSYNSEDDIYTLSATCYLPNAGKFFLTLEPSSFSPTITATVSVTPFLCGAGLGGYACQWAAHNFTGSESINGTVRAYNSSTESNYPADYYFVNLPAGTIANVNFTICSAVSHDIYVTYRKDGFPARSFGVTYGQENSYILSGFSCVAVVIRPEDTILGGSYYVSIENPSSTQPASYSISKTVVTFGTTTDSTTDSETTGESTSAASTLFVPFMYTLIASLALYK